MRTWESTVVFFVLLANAAARAEGNDGNEFKDEDGFSITKPDVWQFYPFRPQQVYTPELKDGEASKVTTPPIVMIVNQMHGNPWPTVDVDKNEAKAQQANDTPEQILQRQVKEDRHDDDNFKELKAPETVQVAGAKAAQTEFTVDFVHAKAEEQNSFVRELVLIHNKQVYYVAMICHTADKDLFKDTFDQIQKSIKFDDQGAPKVVAATD
jgi:hypothetical protein